MRKIKKVGCQFIAVKNERPINCAFDQEQRCNTDCAAFEIKKYNLETFYESFLDIDNDNISDSEEVNVVGCGRGSFIIGRAIPGE